MDLTLFSSFVGSLRIERAKPSDSGKYECVAENSLGTDYSYSANLHVRGESIGIDTDIGAFTLHTSSCGMCHPKHDPRELEIEALLAASLLSSWYKVVENSERYCTVMFMSCIYSQSLCALVIDCIKGIWFCICNS
jgi:hypothetical protein